MKIVEKTKTGEKRLKSPDDMYDYIRISRVSIWLVLCAVLVLLIGFLVWGFGGKLETTQKVTLVSTEDNVITAYLDAKSATGVTEGMLVKIDNTVIGSVNKIVSEQDHFVVFVDGELSIGVFDAEIIIDSVMPMSFVVN